MLDDDAILEIVGGYDGHLDKTCDQLVDGANARGGRDNISAILFRYE
jgi:serine/threonine protein phosphatase PrpC